MLPVSLLLLVINSSSISDLAADNLVHLRLQLVVSMPHFLVQPVPADQAIDAVASINDGSLRYSDVCQLKWQSQAGVDVSSAVTHIHSFLTPISNDICPLACHHHWGKCLYAFYSIVGFAARSIGCCCNTYFCKLTFIHIIVHNTLVSCRIKRKATYVTCNP